jgi:hypothetical protein
LLDVELVVLLLIGVNEVIFEICKSLLFKYKSKFYIYDKSLASKLAIIADDSVVLSEIFSPLTKEEANN